MLQDDEDRFTDFVRAHSASLFRTAYLMTGDYQRAEDLLQTTLVRVYQRWSRVGSMDRSVGYARKMLVSQEASWWRRRSSHESPLKLQDEPAWGGRMDQVAEHERVWEAVMSRPAIDTTSWKKFRSSRYDLTIGHPPKWTEVPATGDWRWPTDARHWASSAQETFVAPANDIAVSVWSVPLDLAKRTESVAYLEAWVEHYCEASRNTPCTGIDDRAVERCFEIRDCHPGLLVPFASDVQAFFSGGIHDADAMTIVAVWRPESHPSVAR